MGRGGYLGGGTIVQAGSDWFSGRGKRKPRPVETACSAEALAFLKLIISTRRIVPEVPKDMSPSLAKEIARFGGPFEWARTRKEYSGLRRPSASTTINGPTKPQVGTRREMELLRQANAVTKKPGGGTMLAESGEPPPRQPSRQQKSAPTQSKPSLTDQARVTYLTALVAGIVRNGPLPNPPRNEPGKWAMDALSRGSLDDWARSQSEFGAIETKMRKRMEAERAKAIGQGQ